MNAEQLGFLFNGLAYEYLHLELINSIICGLAAFATLWLMQIEIKDAGYWSTKGALFAARRLFFVILAVAFSLSAVTPLFNNDTPWPANVLINVGVLALLVTTCVRKS